MSRIGGSTNTNADTVSPPPPTTTLPEHGHLRVIVDGQPCALPHEEYANRHGGILKDIVVGDTRPDVGQQP